MTGEIDWSKKGWEASSHDQANEVLGSVSSKLAHGADLESAVEEVLKECEQNKTPKDVIEIFLDIIESMN